MEACSAKAIRHVLRFEDGHTVALFLPNHCIVCLRAQAPQPKNYPTINHCVVGIAFNHCVFYATLGDEVVHPIELSFFSQGQPL